MLYEGVPGDRMVKLLQIALKCIYKSADARPTMSQVAEMIHSLKEEEDSIWNFLLRYAILSAEAEELDDYPSPTKPQRYMNLQSQS
ncbi:uncharacterized protein A4U43_C07F12840 [Asparagus officinalis]|uniref:Serine-threonine/tyrosine-protein kinase catalytic domain-containing protein n=1 Tax=Asparagus officinalis TaxID=4686 RepID=A0A5P1EEW0_ASPOF|nr:uncharacterized protein A4U43_C07F12840 [Asparagus officinalis]